MISTNDHLVLIAGESGTGKSASLMNLPNQEKVMYLNCEAGKKLPFRNRFKSFVITDPMQIFEAFDHARNNPAFDTIVIDTITFLMDMYESLYVLPSANTMQAWGQYAQYFKALMQDKVASSDKAVIFLGHTRAELDEKAMEMRTSVPVKGSLRNNGIEAYFSTVVATKKIPVKDLEGMDPAMLHINEEERLLGFKHVFQTRITRNTIGERIRAPMGMFTPQQTYIDNDAGALLRHLQEYYA
ncbi:MAG: AAA family ATPase [Gemmobacter sp.]